MTRNGGAPAREFRVWVEGRLSGGFAAGLAGVDQGDEPGGTVLRGDYLDEAHLQGVLDELRGLGIAVRRFEVTDSPSGGQAGATGGTERSTRLEPQMTNAAPTTVRNVSVITTGRAGLHREHMYGTKKPDLWWIFLSSRFETLPVNVFVVEHDDGLVLFDTGPNARLIGDPDYWPDRVTRLFMKNIFRLDVGTDDLLGVQLERAGFRAEQVSRVVLSHLHFDHAGGIADVPDAELLVAPEAWAHMMGEHPEREAVVRRDLEIDSTRWRLMDFQPTSDPDLAPFTEAFDVTGDGSMMVLPTPGHLPGSVSMLIRRHDAPPVLLIGDLSYSEDLLQRDQVPATGDGDVLRQSFAKVRALKQHTPDLVIVASHDITAAAKLASGVAATPATAEPS